jgi:hypothetical protein
MRIRDALGDQAILRAEAVRASSHSDSPNSKRGPPLPIRVLALAVTAGVAYVSLRFGTAARALCIRRTAAPALPAGWPPPRRCRCSSKRSTPSSPELRWRGSVVLVVSAGPGSLRAQLCGERGPQPTVNAHRRRKVSILSAQNRSRQLKVGE